MDIKELSALIGLLKTKQIVGLKPIVWDNDKDAYDTVMLIAHLNMT